LPVDPAHLRTKELRRADSKMVAVMRAAPGVVAAPQMGSDSR
jgi:peptide deformylase